MTCGANRHRTTLTMIPIEVWCGVNHRTLSASAAISGKTKNHTQNDYYIYILQLFTQISNFA